jgi:hypothetical protein
MLSIDEHPYRPVRHVRGEDVELDRDELLGAFLGGVGKSAPTGKAPDDDNAGESLDGAIEAEADQSDGPGDDPGEDRHRAFDCHVSEACPESHFAFRASRR